MENTECVQLSPRAVEALLRFDEGPAAMLTTAGGSTFDWSVPLTAAILGLCLIEAVRIAFLLWRDYL